VVENITDIPNPSAAANPLKNPELLSWLPDPPEPSYTFFRSNLFSIWRYAYEANPRICILEFEKLALELIGVAVDAKIFLKVFYGWLINGSKWIVFFYYLLKIEPKIDYSYAY